MRIKCSREVFTKKCRQQQIFDSDLKGAWHYNHVTFTPIAKNFMLYCRLIYMLSILFVRLTIKVKVGIPESFKVGWYPPKKTGSSHLSLLLSAFISFCKGPDAINDVPRIYGAVAVLVGRWCLFLNFLERSLLNGNHALKNSDLKIFSSRDQSRYLA